jgi:hypothetical protein
VRVRFQADADLNHVILLAAIRREPLIDFQSARAAGIGGLSDLDVLSIAAREGRVLVTHDQRTMPAHFAEFVASGVSPGLVLAPQHLAPVVVAEELLLIWTASDASEWTNRIAYLPL